MLQCKKYTQPGIRASFLGLFLVVLFPAACKVLTMKDYSLFSIVLAAGKSERFGSTKQLATISGQALVALAVRRAEAVSGRKSVLVVGNDWQAVAEACRPLLGYLALNPLVAAGISESIRVGLKCVANHADGILLMLADQPLVDSAHLQALERRWRDAPDSIVASEFANTLGPPVIFPRRDFDALSSLSGDRGAKDLLRANSGRVNTVAFEPAAIDIDSAGDLSKIQE